MPNIIGGDQLDPAYASWAWIGEHFVWNTAREVVHDGQTYKIGRTSEGKIVCARRVEDDSLEMISLEDTPAEVMKEMDGVTFEGERQRTVNLAREIQPNLPEGQIFRSKHLERE